MFVVSVLSGVVCGNLRLVDEVKLFVISQCVTFFFVPHFGVSAWHLKCTKHVRPNSDIVQ